MTQVASFDIGSTWTKGALCALDPPSSRTVRRGAVPTTQHDLAEDFPAEVVELATQELQREDVPEVATP